MIISLLCTAMLECIFLFVIGPEFDRSAQGMVFFDMQLFTSAEEILSQAANLSPAAVKVYGRMQLIDFFFPISYTILLISLLPRESDRRLAFVPFSAGLCDLSENLIIYRILHGRNTFAGALLLFTHLKFLLIILSVILIIVVRIRAHTLKDAI